MLRLLFIACLLVAPAIQAARPKLIHQSQTLVAPAEYDAFGHDMAIDGDWAIIMAATPSPRGEQTQNHDALLYRRVNGQWTFDRLLLRRVQTSDVSNLVYFRSVAMSNGLAAIGSNPTHVFKRTNESWSEIPHPFTAPRSHPDHVDGQLVWDGNTLLAERPSCAPGQSWGALVATLLSDGTWTPVQRISGADPDCMLDPLNWDLSGNTAIAATDSFDQEVIPSHAQVFRRSGTSWMHTASVDGGDGQIGVRGNELYFSVGLPGAGARVYRNDDALTIIDRLRTVTAGYGGWGRANSLEHSNDVVLVDRDVYRKNVAGKYEHVATLVNRGLSTLTGLHKMSGRYVISSARAGANGLRPAVMIHELPTSYTSSPVIATGFNGAVPLTPQVGTFAVVTTADGNRVYRQSSQTGQYRALVDYSDWQEQSLQADIGGMAVTDWAGLAVRYLDESNYYAVAIQSDDVLALRVMRNGELSTVAQRPLPNALIRNHRVAIRVLNNDIRAYLEGREVLRYVDPAPIPHGSAALIGAYSTVDYDNIVAAQVGQRSIYDLDYDGWCNGELIYTNYYTRTGPGTWSCDYVVDTDIMRQTSTTDIARAIIGMTPTDDQVIQAWARMNTVNGPDRWMGLVARYVDDSNYYYLSVRRGGSVSLRKLVDGTATVLATATLPVTLGAWYDLRLDVVGNELRAFVNGTQMLQAIDSSHAQGRAGMITYKATAEWRSVLTVQP